MFYKTTDVFELNTEQAICIQVVYLNGSDKINSGYYLSLEVKQSIAGGLMYLNKPGFKQQKFEVFLKPAKRFNKRTIDKLHPSSSLVRHCIKLAKAAYGEPVNNYHLSIKAA